MITPILKNIDALRPTCLVKGENIFFKAVNARLDILNQNDLLSAHILNRVSVSYTVTNTQVLWSRVNIYQPW